MHTFLVPVASIEMSGDYKWAGHHSIASLQGNTRSALLSASVQPDFELSTVMMELCSLKEKEVRGKPSLNYSKFPSNQAKTNDSFRERYEQDLKEYLIYHLSSKHSLPPTSKVTPYNRAGAIKLLEGLIKKKGFSPQDLVNKYVSLEGHTISLEVLLNVYIEQLKSEFKALDARSFNPYIYTINPPSIFAFSIGMEAGVQVLNRLQALAFKQLLLDEKFALNLSQVGFSDYADKTLIPFLSQVFSSRSIDVTAKAQLFQGPNGTYSGPKETTLVIHNNSDAFGQNIETEGASSLDGVIGSYSNAACALSRERPDLLSQIVSA